MKRVNTIARARRAFHVQGWSMKKIVRDLHVSRNTVRKIAEHPHHHCPFRKILDLNRSLGLIGGFVLRNRNVRVRVDRHTAAEQEHRDLRDGGWRRPACDVELQSSVVTGQGTRHVVALVG